MTFKVLGIGLPKTGTTTLYHALLHAGFKSAHRVFDQRTPPCGQLMQKAWHEGEPLHKYLPKGLEVVTQLDTLREPFAGTGYLPMPQTSKPFLMEFRRQYPDALLVLHTRDPRATVRSIRQWNTMRQRWPKYEPTLNEDCDERELRAWILQHYDRLRSWLDKDPRFVEFDIADEAAPKILGRALGMDLPWWGAANVRASREQDGTTST